MAYDQLLLSNQLCFRFYALERELMAAYRPLLDHLGLTYAQYITLLYLWEHEKATVGELCTALSLDTGTMSPLLKRLESAKLIERHRLPSDERTVEVLLTKTGRELEQKAVSIPGHIATCLLSSDRDEQGKKYAELREMLDQTLERLKRTRKEREAGK
ncbi:MAG: MarR family transcriptional regulator [Sphaerochaeta sp.]|jgi:DNA-binding MarR family transcriptional regulator|uniref:MarR family winged helix-turn-helix transcriptional regulator n=1 Tax=unclassified Sphaerochaeta TaxID=2637943 RepID=UPI000E8B0901|nr:MarR family transcriptional regulator [Sphaerochaeta sp. UBA5856]MCK9601688.1 MarR family transcriptional regulator [Sphaerochaeta sp.]MEA4866068.1 MarR family transcriptional regulator [Sphaerochaeta sp.]HBO35105.1 MarR family transcriptional regulator [Sphaerochaeta sp.]